MDGIENDCRFFFVKIVPSLHQDLGIQRVFHEFPYVRDLSCGRPVTAICKFMNLGKSDDIDVRNVRNDQHGIRERDTVVLPGHQHTQQL